MSIRFLLFAAASLFIALSGSLLAQQQDAALETQRLQAALSVINAEIKANLDEVMAVQEALKANSMMPLEAQGRSPDAVSFDDLAAAQRRAMEKEAAMKARLDAILARNAALDAEKQPLLVRVRELLQVPQASPR
jgi:hypothetical protein